LIDILLTTYNGEKYLSLQLDSLLKQTNNDIRILIRDDSSSDETLTIIKQYSNLFPDTITLISDNLGNLGCSKSFMRILEYSNAPYIMLCDQDDIWMQNKVEQSLEKLQELEISFSKDIPLLVFTDMEVVDNNLRLIHDSFWKYQQLPFQITHTWKKLLAQNVITGCTIIMNQAAKKVSLPFTLDTMMHDHWIGVNVSKNGQISYLETPSILYRQHEANVEGARKYGWKYIVYKIQNILVPLQKIYIFSRYFKVSFFQILFYKITINLKRLLETI